ncbi:MAG: amidohydrolase family protein [bacterium]|nr:amidohydrolase family protein [bacterium]
MHYEVISADCHIDLCWLPPDLFTTNAPAHLKDRMPYVTDGPDGPFWTTRGGANLGLQNGMGSAGRKYVPGEIERSDRMAAKGLFDDGKKGIRRVSDPQLRLQDQDLDGVQGEVIYGILGAAKRVDEPEIVPDLYRIYNTWLADFCKTYPDRYVGLACIPNTDGQLAADEVRRGAKLGLKGGELAVSSDIVPLWHPQWEVLWEAAAECDMPISFHTLSNRVLPNDVEPLTRRAAFASMLSVFQLTTADFLASMIFNGALERYPNLKIVLGESGIGWIPYMLERMDYEWEDQFTDLTLTMKPSEYWHRQMYATYQQDVVGIKLIEELGEDNIMWGSDFPHPDGVWPDSQTFIETQLGHLPPPVRRKIVCDTAAKLYGFEQE